MYRRFNWEKKSTYCMPLRKNQKEALPPRKKDVDLIKKRYQEARELSKHEKKLNEH